MCKNVFFVVFLCFSSAVSATVDCPKARVESIQPDIDFIYIRLEGQNWQRLGNYSQPSTPSKLSVALAAHASGKKVLIRFPDGHNAECSSFNKTVDALMIRITDE
ncbi:hypothetical protein [Marinagarivorans algicola]|uniref:hypothetical protein n=1 Tax=Marinagarivorans algicola TaxID=1513270 RepID=UPI0006B9D6F3|nr:hypothetical protein [Marinagarivorans algicola]